MQTELNWNRGAGSGWLFTRENLCPMKNLLLLVGLLAILLIIRSPAKAQTTSLYSSPPLRQHLSHCHAHQPARAAATVRLLYAAGREVLRQPAARLKTSVSVAALVPGPYTAQWLAATGRVLMSRKAARE